LTHFLWSHHEESETDPNRQGNKYTKKGIHTHTAPVDKSYGEERKLWKVRKEAFIVASEIYIEPLASRSPFVF